MQATISNTAVKGFGFNRITTTFMALGLAAGIAIGASGEAVIDNLRNTAVQQQSVAMPKAHTSTNQGDGLVAGNAALTPAIRSFGAVEQGEGTVGGHHVVTDSLVAHASPGQGEGILAGVGSNAVLKTPVQAYDHSGMGEGWITTGRPVSTLKAYSSNGQGEGRIGLTAQ